MGLSFSKATPTTPSEFFISRGLLDDALIRTTSTAAPGVANVYRFRLVDMGGDLTTMQNDEVIDTFNVEYNPARGGFYAHWLPFGFNQSFTITLPPAGGGNSVNPDIMLTPTLSGCSVGFCRFSNGSLRVYHANFQATGGGMDVARQTAALIGCPTASQLHPTSYRGVHHGDRASDMLVQVVGIRDADGWHIYAQQYQQDGLTSFTLLSVTEIP
ncbi:hypothetical protein [Azospirillum oleiclasticum]|nr:hypothetical protein [Azospirillum oleiclasticum]